MNEMTVYDANQDVVVARPPEIVLDEAKKAAKALADVVSGKKKPVIMNGEQYLEFEDWQTVGRFYGVTAKIISTTFIDYGSVQGFEARAVAIRADGMEISAAEAMCLNDEPNWKSKPMFQLRSMAQTRAAAKSLRNVLAWVVVLAGYKPTPAEEMTGNEQKPPIQEPQKKAESGDLVVITSVLNVEAKKGEKNGKPYTIFGITGEGDVIYKTFSDSFADLATTAKANGNKVKIAYRVGKYGNDITALVVEEK